MLLELSAFSKIPRANRVVQSTGPQFRAIGGNVDAGRSIRVTLELSDQSLILKIPDGDAAVAAAAEADLRIRRDRQSVTGGGGRD